MIHLSIPSIEDDGFVLYESTAILDYLEATHPTPPLVPSDARGRALVAMHVKLCDVQLARQTGAIIFPKRFLPKERWDVAAMEQAKKDIELAKAQAIPNVTVLAGFGHDWGNIVTNAAQVGISVPLPLFYRNEGQIAQAGVRANDREVQVRRTENTVLPRRVSLRPTPQPTPVEQKPIEEPAPARGASIATTGPVDAAMVWTAGMPVMRTANQAWSGMRSM